MFEEDLPTSPCRRYSFRWNPPKNSCFVVHRDTLWRTGVGIRDGRLLKKPPQLVDRVPTGTRYWTRLCFPKGVCVPLSNSTTVRIREFLNLIFICFLYGDSYLVFLFLFVYLRLILGSNECKLRVLFFLESIKDDDSLIVKVNWGSLRRRLWFVGRSRVW